MNIYSPAQIRSHTLPAHLLIFDLKKKRKKKKKVARTHKSHTSLISPRLAPGHRDLHRQLIFPAHISHQSDKKSDANAFSEATPPASPLHHHPPSVPACSYTSHTLSLFFFEGLWSVIRRSNRGLLDPDGRKAGLVGVLMVFQTVWGHWAALMASSLTGLFCIVHTHTHTHSRVHLFTVYHFSGLTVNDWR